MQVTVAVTVAGVPTGAAKPLVSTSTRCAVQRTPWFRRLAAAPETPLASAWPACGRSMRTGPLRRRASTACRAIAIRPAAMINSTNSRNAGTPITASMVAEPRSRLLCRVCWLIRW